MVDTKTLAAKAEADARRLAAEFEAQSQDGRLGAAKARAARSILQLAEQRAALVRRDDVRRLIGPGRHEFMAGHRLAAWKAAADDLEAMHAGR